MKKFRGIIVVLLSVFLVATCFSGCKSSSTPAKSSILLGISDQDTSLLWKGTTDELEKLAKAEGWRTVSAITGGDVEKGIENAQSFIAQGCKYMFFQCSDAGEMQTVQTMCNQAGVKVVMDGMETPGFVIVSGPNYDGGVLAGQHLGEAVQKDWGGQFDLLIVAGIPSLGLLNSERMDGELAGFEDEVVTPSTKIVNVDTPIDKLQDTTIMTNTLTAYPNAKHIALLGFMDQFEVIPMINAANAAGRLNQLLMVGFLISDPSAPTLLKEYPNIWLGDTDFSAIGGAQEAWSLIMKWNSGKTVPNGIYDQAAMWIDSTNVDQYYPGLASST